MATYASYTLSSKDFAPTEVTDYISEIGQFAEITYSTLPPTFIFDNLPTLMEPTFPLEGYHSLQDARLLASFTGRAGALPGYLAFRPQTKQLVLAFAGTTTLTQALYDVRALPHRHPSRRGTVHSGFWKLYKGVKARALDAVRAGLAAHAADGVAEFVVTGHSMGAAVAQLLLLDILRDEALLPLGAIPLRLVVFGGPRSGDADLVAYWCELMDARRAKHGEGAIAEYSVKAYNDGVPSLPPLALGYRHYVRSPFYFVHGRLYQVPPASREYALFHVTPDPDDEDIPPAHPRGGHNYYNGRDMEKFSRRMLWLMKAMKKEKKEAGDWKEQYRAKVAKHSVGGGATTASNSP